MRHKLLIYLAIVGLFFSIVSISYCADKKVSKKAETKKIEEQKDNTAILADAIRALRAEVLNWQKKYHMERYTNMQLRAINSLCITQEFVDNQQTIIDLQKKIQQQQLIGGQIQ